MNPVLSKILEWCKNNWVVFVIAGLVLFFWYQHVMQNQLITDMAKQSQEEFARHTQDLQEMRTAYEHEHAAQEAINQQYNETIQRLQTDYNQRISDLEHQTTQRRQRFVTETSGHPAEMADRVRQRLGWSQ